MNKRNLSILSLFIISTVSSTQEHRHEHSNHIHQPRPIVRSHETNDLHAMIDIPDRPSHEDRIGSPEIIRDTQRFKAKLVAITAIATTLITGGVFLIVHLTNCK
jgi:hypothetical protein